MKWPRCKEGKLSYFNFFTATHQEIKNNKIPLYKMARDTVPLILYITTPSNIPVGTTVPLCALHSYHSVTVHWLDVQRSFIAAINFLLRQFGNHCYRENLKGSAGQRTANLLYVDPTVFIICGPYLFYVDRIYYMRTVFIICGPYLLYADRIYYMRTVFIICWSGSRISQKV